MDFLNLIVLSGACNLHAVINDDVTDGVHRQYKNDT